MSMLKYVARDKLTKGSTDFILNYCLMVRHSVYKCQAPLTVASSQNKILFPEKGIVMFQNS